MPEMLPVHVEDRRIDRLDWSRYRRAGQRYLRLGDLERERGSRHEHGNRDTQQDPSGNGCRHRTPSHLTR